jgi:hypothetical protein
MHAEAVPEDAIPSKQGLFRDESRPVKCLECNIKYVLHYDSEAEPVLTFCGILAEELVMARHPNHARNVALDLVGLNQAQRQRQVVRSTRTSLSYLLKKKPDLR